jgi:hypothetical protein
MMFYNVIFLEGVRKIGKSSQCVLLRQSLGKDREVHQLNLDQQFSPSELFDKINEIRAWCTENPTGTLIVNGSLAYSIVYKDLENQKYGSSYDEFELPIKNFLNLLRELKIISILLKANDYEYLKTRYAEDENYNPVEVRMLYDGFEFFEGSQNFNFKWHRVEISKYDSILQINTKILKHLE